MQVETKGLNSTVKKVGGVLILHIIFMLPMLNLLIVPFNLLKLKGGIEFLGIELPISTLASFLLYMILSLLILKANIKEIFTNKRRENQLEFKSIFLLYIFFIATYVFLSMCINYPTGLYKVIDETYGDIFSSNTILITLILASFLEEIFFRGVLLERLRKYGDLFAIITSAIIFGIIHGIRFMHATIFGIITGFLYVVGGNIRWSILFHFVINFVFGGPFIGNILTALFSRITVVDDVFVLASVMILSGTVLVISFVLCRKDDGLVKLGHGWNKNVIVDQIKQDKVKYKIFFKSPMIIIFFIWEIFRMLNVFLS